MGIAPVSSAAEVHQLKQFHQDHFPGQVIPTITTTNPDEAYLHESSSNETEIGDLGHYADGVRRTLTDDQIAMFRNSEIQRLLSERRRQREQEEAESDAQEEDEKGYGHEHEADSKRTGTNEPQHVKRRRFADEALEDVQSLVYDDEPSKTGNEATGFLWPKLG